MKLKRTTITSLLFKIFVPSILALVALGVAVDMMVVRRLTHLKHVKPATGPQDYLEISNVQLPWSDEQWMNSDSTISHGWLLRRGANSPAIILSHGYGDGANRSDLLDLGVDLWRAGYTVLMYDLRGHGESAVEWTSLGDYESDDLVSAIKYLKTVKDSSGAPLIDPSRIGLYGVSLGGYASLVAAAEDSGVRAVAVDSVYPTPDSYAHVLTREEFGVSSKVINDVVDLGLWATFQSRYTKSSAIDAVRNYQDVQLMLIGGANAADLRQTTGLVYIQSLEPHQITEVGMSRIYRLRSSDSAIYNQMIIDFFKRTNTAPTTTQAQKPKK
ncbi:MAG TPA: alpha/beta fold hydrolase [Blastocatellia bacterium]|nr:alpha/beta fold hydrolase [Blastocatellia bacterium]